MTTRRRWFHLGSLALLALFVVPASAQVTPDPYSPWNAMYRPFVFPNTYSNPAIPNQARLPYLVDQGASPYGATFFESMNGFDPNLFNVPARMGGRGVPYYQTFRSQRAAAADQGLYDRTYIPNRNDTFYEDQAARQQRLIDARAARNPRELNQARLEQERFFQALRQRDPQARSRMLSALEARRAGVEPGIAKPEDEVEPNPRSGAAPRSNLAPFGAVPREARTSPPTSSGLNLLRPLSPVLAPPPPRAGVDRRDGLEDAARRAIPPTARFPVPPEIENLLEPEGDSAIDRIPGLPPAPEPR